MTQPVNFGLPGVAIEPGDHLCAFYLGANERDDVVVPYMQAGLAAGHKCLGVVDSIDPSELLAKFGSDVDVDACVASKQLELHPSTTTYMQDGFFSTERMIDFWEHGVGDAVRGGQYDWVRVFGEMTWSLRDAPGVEDLADYESEVNRFAPLYPQAILCLYDLTVFGGGILVDLLKTHPKLLLGGMVLDNPHYLSPDEFRASRQ
jgi:hypothetical protein